MNLDDEKVAENNISNLEEFEIIIPKEVSEKVDIQDLDICFLQDFNPPVKEYKSREEYLK